MRVPPIHPGDLLWEPEVGSLTSSGMGRYLAGLAGTRGLRFADYAAHFQICFQQPPVAVLAGRAVDGVWMVA